MKDLLGIAFTIFFGIVYLMMFTGCAPARYNLGYWQGKRAYKHGKETGYVINGFGVGYSAGFLHLYQLDDIGQKIEKSKRILQGIDRPVNQLNQSLDDFMKEEIDDFMKEEIK